jgi:glycosyltransferase involved in cell wall biosynthesis
MDLSQTPVQIPKRVLIFSFVYFPRFIGGAEIAVKEITHRINPREVSFSMVTLHINNDLPSFERIGNIDVYRVGFAVRPNSPFRKISILVNKLLYPLLGTIKAVLLHQKNKFDRTWSIMANYSSAAAYFFSLIYPKVPFMLTLQEGDPIEWTLKRVKPVMYFYKKMFKRTDHVQTISTYLAHFAETMGARSVSVVPNGVDVDFFSQMFPQSALEALNAKLQRKEGESFVITASRLVHKNGVDSVISAMKYLDPSIRFIICGVGPDEAYLKELARIEGVEDRVTFVGHVGHEELPKYLRISDVFIRASRSEGFGNAFVEAMATGIPVIATPVGGITDFLTDKKTGLFCAVDDASDIAHKISILLRDINLSKELVNEAKKMVKERYDWKKISKDMERLFQG